MLCGKRPAGNSDFQIAVATGRVLGRNVIVKRILHVLASPRAEGTPRLVLDWLTVKEHVQGVVFLTKEPAELLGDFVQTGCWLQVCDKPLGRGLAKYPQVIGEVNDAVRKFKPDIVLAWPAGLAHLIHLGARTACRCALLTHSGTAPARTFYRRYVYTWMCFGIARLCGHRVVACSEYVRQQYLAIPFLTRKHILAAYNCCNVEKFIPPFDSVRRPDRVCMVGSLESSKDYASLLNAWRLVEQRGDFELIIAGGGSRRSEYEDLASHLNLKKVTFLGAIREVPEVLWSSRVFAFSANNEEGFGTVLIEALAAGCRIVAADVPACRELLRQGEFGLLVPPKDPVLFANALVEALSKSQGAEETDEARAYARSFTPARMVAEYVRILESPLPWQDPT